MAKKKEQTPEDIQKRIQENLEYRLKELRSQFNPKNPTYSFEPEEEVIYGGHEKTIVKEKIDDGLYYLVEVFAIDKNTKELVSSGLSYVSWISIRKKVDFSKETRLSSREFDRINYMQQSIFSLFVYAYQAGVDMNPEYQRDHVWEESDKVALIDSIMNNVDIGKFVLVERNHKESTEKGTGYYEILDGKQCFSAILEFFEDRFRYKGKLFSELHGYDRAHFDTYPISVANIQNVSMEKRIEIFLKLNTAGRIMDKDHLEKVKKMLLK